MGDIRIGINGFGRIGRCAAKQFLAKGGFRIVGINDLADIGDLAYLLKYDSVHGWYPSKVSSTDRALRIGDQEVAFSSETDPARLPWSDLGAQVILECTGVFRKRDAAAKHLEAGASKVIISAPADDADGTFVLGVNSRDYDPSKHDIVSMASCTTNCIAPVAKALHGHFGVEHIIFTTVHAYTASQSLMDKPMRKRRRGRAASLSIIPTTTGAANATVRVLPELDGRIDGMAVRVPIPDGSITDIVAMLKTDVTVAAVNESLSRAAAGEELKGILRVTDEAIVSSDILGDPHSSIVDAESTMVLRDRVVKVLAWYDNEWGYSARLVDFAGLIGASLP